LLRLRTRFLCPVSMSRLKAFAQWLGVAVVVLGVCGGVSRWRDSRRAEDFASCMVQAGDRQTVEVASAGLDHFFPAAQLKAKANIFLDSCMRSRGHEFRPEEFVVKVCSKDRVEYCYSTW
jgi:hypothetical protein